MKLVLITGMSGAGKAVALKTLEDCGFEAIDNLPLTFLPAVAASGARTRNLAVASDIRSRDFSVEHIVDAIQSLKASPNLDFTMLFLDCDNEVLRRRFSETRRRHPLAQDRTVMDGLSQEREQIQPLRRMADLVIDTSDYEAAELRQVIISHFAREERQLSLSVTSFSFKHGIPRDADLVFDVRFLKNPYYEPTLKERNGLDKKVGDYIEADVGFADFFSRLTGMITPLLPRYVTEGKNYLTIAIGCTGGQHRSVHVAKKLKEFLQQKGYQVNSKHRDMV